MKNTLIALLLLISVTTSYSQDKEATKKMLKNDKTVEMIMNTILNDHQLMTKFIKLMKSNKHASMMIMNSLQKDHKLKGMDHKKMTSTKYVCPMHPKEISDKPENCSKCHMKLKKMGKSKHMNH